MVDSLIRPRGPYSLQLTARRAGDATRVFRHGVLQACFAVDGAVEQAAAAQRPDGTVLIRADSEGGVELLRFCLAVDDDHSEFLRRFRSDPMIGRSVRWLAGMRQIRVPTVAHALLRALCGQLIEASRARQIERRIVRACSPGNGLCPSPSAAALAAFSPAELRRLELHARRGATLVRLCRSSDLERLRELPTPVVAERLLRERGLGPWSVGLISLEGLGRPELGLVGDLSLVKLLSALRGRRVEAWETAELLEPYGEWAGLAGLYLMSGWARGLLPVPRFERRAA